jgi:hypothetical protein
MRFMSRYFYPHPDKRDTIVVRGEAVPDLSADLLGMTVYDYIPEGTYDKIVLKAGLGLLRDELARDLEFVKKVIDS